ncbi:MAG: NUDIX domain-containing protein [Bdellovibrionales bacterium]|nr:NUDIX domain-containing protein [Bdellovibrionales bacterium]
MSGGPGRLYRREPSIGATMQSHHPSRGEPENSRVPQEPPQHKVQRDLPPTNVKSRQDHPAYIKEGVLRVRVPNDAVAWEIPCPEYDEAEQEPYTHSAVLAEYERNGPNGWAASPGTKMFRTDARSYENDLPTNEKGEVLNPRGRTGIKDGTGLLGTPGANFAADPIIIQRTKNGTELRLLVVERADTKQWALPGGMVDFGEKVTQTLARELAEETGLWLDMDDAVIVYQGYVDDPRNTDKAWMETTAALKIVEEASLEGQTLQVDSESSRLKWLPIDRDYLPELYANHTELLALALERIRAPSDRIR